MDKNKLYNENDDTINVDLSDEIKPLLKTGNVKQYNGKRTNQKQQTNKLISPLKCKSSTAERFSIFDDLISQPDDSEIIIDLDTIDSSYSSTENDQPKQTAIVNNKLSSLTPTTQRIDYLQKVYDYRLSEYAVEEMDKKNPGMTARERVLNWRIDKNWPNIDNFIDDVQSYSSTNCKDLEVMDTTPIITNNCKPSKFPSIDSSDCQSDLLSQLKMIQEENPLPSAIKIRRNYVTKQQQQSAKKPFKMPETPIVITTSTTRTTTDDENSTTNNDNIPIVFDAKNDANEDNDDVEMSNNPKCESPLTSPKSNQEEFYKYLGINTTPCHDKKPINSNQLQTSLSAGKRRSLRVKVQQIAINNIAKFNKEQENKVQETAAIAEKLVVDDGHLENRRELVKRRLIDDSPIKSVKNFRNKHNDAPSSKYKVELISMKAGKSLETKSENLLQQPAEPLTKLTYRPPEKLPSHNIVKQYSSCVMPQVLPPTTTISSSTMLSNHITSVTCTTTKPSMLERRDYNKVMVKSTKPINTTSTSTKKSLYQAKILIDESDQQSNKNHCTGTIDSKSQISEPIINLNRNPIVVIETNEAAEIASKNFIHDDLAKAKITTTIGTPTTTKSTTTPETLLEITTTSLPSNDINTSTSGLSPTLSDKQKALKQLISISQGESRQKLNILRRKQLKETIAQTKKSLRRCSRRSQKLVHSAKLKRSKHLKKTAAAASTFVKRKTFKLSKPIACSTVNRNNNNNNNNEKRLQIIPTSNDTVADLMIDNVSQKTPPHAILDSGLESDALKLSDIDQSDIAVDRTTISTIISPDYSPIVIQLTEEEEEDDDNDDDDNNINDFVIANKTTDCEMVRNVNDDDNQMEINHIKQDEDVIVNSAKKQFEMLAMLYTNNTIITVSDALISFWMCPSRIYTTFTNDGIPEWKLIGSIDRDNKDIEIQAPYQNRICSSNSKFTAYFELRAKEFKPNDTRECYLTAVYVNIYLLDADNKCIVQHVDLDRFSCESKTIHYIVLPDEGKFVMAWTEQLQNRRRCGVCRYSLLDLDLLSDIDEFPLLHHSINSMACIEADKLFGFGDSTITMWNHRSGDLLLNIDLEYGIGHNLSCLLWNEMNEKCLFLAQCCYTNDTDYPSIKLIALNLTKSFRYTVVAEHKMPTKCKRITSISMTTDELVIIFENNQSVLLSLLNTDSISVKFPKPCSNKNIVQTFVQNGRIYEITDDMHINVKTIYEYFSNLCDINTKLN